MIVVDRIKQLKAYDRNLHAGFFRFSKAKLGRHAPCLLGGAALAGLCRALGFRKARAKEADKVK